MQLKRALLGLLCRDHWHHPYPYLYLALSPQKKRPLE